MKKYRSEYIQCGITKYRLAELKAFCRQYQEKIGEANALLSISSPKMTGMPHVSGTSDTVEKAVEKREKLMKDCEMIESCAMAVDGGKYYMALLQNVCFGKAYHFITEYLPTSYRKAFYDARRDFFILLNNAVR